jgi:hypothetical protein
MKHTKDELIRVSSHLFYEFSMLINMTEEIRSSKYNQGSTVSNALIEAFTMHVRIILDFLYEKKKRPDDAVVGDFFSTQDVWLKIRPKMPPILNNISKRVNKEVAHLTYSRLKVTPSTKTWHVVDIAKDILKVFDKFLENVSRELLDESWNQYYSIKNRFIYNNSIH